MRRFDRYNERGEDCDIGCSIPSKSHLFKCESYEKLKAMRVENMALKRHIEKLRETNSHLLQVAMRKYRKHKATEKQDIQDVLDAAEKLAHAGYQPQQKYLNVLREAVRIYKNNC